MFPSGTTFIGQQPSFDPTTPTETPPYMGQAGDGGNVSKPIEEDDNINPSSSSDSEAEIPMSCTIEVSGVAFTTSEETLRMFFKSRKKSGGGEIEQLWHNKEKGTYVITFKKREGMHEL